MDTSSHRWRRISLRSLLALVTLLSVLLAAWVGYREAYRRQMQAVERIAAQLDLEWTRDTFQGNNLAVRAYLDDELVDFVAYVDRSSWAGWLVPESQRLNVESITCNADRAAPLVLKELSNFPELTYLCVQTDNVTDDDLVGLANLPNLETLTLSAEKATDHAMFAVGRARKLRYISLSCPLLTDQGVAELAGLPALADIDLYGTQVTGQGIARLSGLERLQISHQPWTDVDMAALAGCPQLSGLVIDHVGITPAALHALAISTGVTCLDIDDPDLTDAGLAEVAQLDGLNQLSLSNCNPTAAGFGHLAGLPIEWLCLKACPIFDDAIPKLMGLPQLSNLYVDTAEITDTGLEELATWKSLKTLSLGRTRCTKPGIARFKQSRPDVSLGISGSPEDISDSGLPTSSSGDEQVQQSTGAAEAGVVQPSEVDAPSIAPVR